MSSGVYGRGVYDREARVGFARGWNAPVDAPRIPFRSTLEAKWARVFSKLGCPWAYEPTTFSLPDGRTYTPDFRLDTPEGTSWIEVKPAPLPMMDALPKLETFRAAMPEGSRLIGLCASEPRFHRYRGEGSPVIVLLEHGQGLFLSETPAIREVSGPEMRKLVASDPSFVEIVRQTVERLNRRRPDKDMGDYVFRSMLDRGMDFNEARALYLAKWPDLLPQSA